MHDHEHGHHHEKEHCCVHDHDHGHDGLKRDILFIALSAVLLAAVFGVAVADPIPSATAEAHYHAHFEGKPLNEISVKSSVLHLSDGDSNNLVTHWSRLQRKVLSMISHHNLNYISAFALTSHLYENC